VKRRRRRKRDEVKVVLRKPARGTTFRCGGAEAVAVFSLGFATHALLVGDVVVFAIFAVVAGLAAVWGAGWRVLVRHGPPQ
jgi:hypothetical protein